MRELLKEHDESIPQQIVRGVIESGEKQKFEMRFSIDTAHESIEAIQADTEALLAVPGLKAEWTRDMEQPDKYSASTDDRKAVSSSPTSSLASPTNPTPSTPTTSIEHWRVVVG